MAGKRTVVAMMLCLLASVGCRHWCERWCPCNQPVSYAPAAAPACVPCVPVQCCPTPGVSGYSSAPPAVPAASAAPNWSAPRTGTCVCPP